MEKMVLYHTGVQEIEKPNISIGRANADFGKGFYLSVDAAFSKYWVKKRSGCDVYINMFELSMEGLNIKRFSRNRDWMAYIFRNRQGEDMYKEYDVIIGPVANDTIYDVLGITAGGLLNEDRLLKLFSFGPEYTQVVIKTEKAVSRLKYLSAEILDFDTIEMNRQIVKQEEAAYQHQVFTEMKSMMK